MSNLQKRQAALENRWLPSGHLRYGKGVNSWALSPASIGAVQPEEETSN